MCYSDKSYFHGGNIVHQEFPADRISSNVHLVGAIAEHLGAKLDNEGNYDPFSYDDEGRLTNTSVLGQVKPKTI